MRYTVWLLQGILMSHRCTWTTWTLDHIVKIISVEPCTLPLVVWLFYIDGVLCYFFFFYSNQRMHWFKEFPPFSAFSSGCVRPYMVQNSWVNLTETNRGSFPVGTVLQYSCDPGYLPDGPSILTCTTIGRWSSEPPQCIRSGGKSLHPQTSFLCCQQLAFFNNLLLYKKTFLWHL